MFEHMKNYELLMRKISRWIKPGGKVNHFNLLLYDAIIIEVLVIRSYLHPQRLPIPLPGQLDG
jgi:hypothetical protein